MSNPFFLRASRKANMQCITINGSLTFKHCESIQFNSVLFIYSYQILIIGLLFYNRVHETGHNLGLQHSGEDDPNDGQKEYADSTGYMVRA